MGALALFAWYWTDGLPYDATSGVWIALAHDVADGVLYRPVHGPDGFGGTRYMPLFFSLHGLAVRAGLPLVGSGVALSLASLALLLAGVAVLLRRAGATPSTVLAAPLLLLASVSVQLLGVAVKGDFLAAALGAWGLALALPSGAGPAPRSSAPGAGEAAAGESAERGGVPRAALLLWTLAFATKLTALAAPTAYVLAVARAGRRRLALRTAGVFAAACVAVVVVVVGGSAGRAIGAFSLSATGGTAPGYALGFLGHFLWSARQDPFFVALLLLGTVLVPGRVRRVGADLVVLWWLAALLQTLAVFASPGVDLNHFVDVLAPTVVLVGLEAEAAGGRRRRAAAAGLAVVACMVVASWLPGTPSVHGFFLDRGRPTRSGLERLRAELGEAAPGPLLPEDPLVPLLWTGRAEVADPFNLRLLALSDPDAAGDFDRRLSGRYRAVILTGWTGSTLAEARAHLRHDPFYGTMNFPPGFIDRLFATYKVTAWQSPWIGLTRR